MHCNIKSRCKNNFTHQFMFSFLRHFYIVHPYPYFPYLICTETLILLCLFTWQLHYSIKLGKNHPSREQLESDSSCSVLLRTASATSPQNTVSAAGCTLQYLLIVSLKKITKLHCRNFRAKSSNRRSTGNLRNSLICAEAYIQKEF